jgi:hypothetical protein
VAAGSTLTLLQVLPARALQPGAVQFNPQSGPVGTTVTITGVGFQDDSVVTDVEFNGTPAAFAVNSDNQLRATVPAGATTGTISVTDDEGTFTTLTDFTVSSGEPPVVAAFAPTSGPAGGRVTITGTNFTVATAASFNGRPASFTVASESQIAATVPVGASSGPISVTTSGVTGTSLVEFTVTDPGEMHKRGINLQLRRRVARGRVTARDGRLPSAGPGPVRVLPRHGARSDPRGRPGRMHGRHVGPQEGSRQAVT